MKYLNEQKVGSEKLTEQNASREYAGMLNKSISIIIPSYNEAQSIHNVIEGIEKLCLNNAEVIVVDDGSTDGSFEKPNNCFARILRHPYNKGNGAAIKTGIRHAKGDILVMLDADGQHNPNDIPRLVEDMEQYDMVVGARYFNHLKPNMRNAANQIYNLLATYLTGMRIHDLTSGFRAIKRDVACRFISMLPNGFSCPSTLTLGLIKSGYSVKFIPIKTNKRIGNSKIKIIRDGTKFLLILMKIAGLYSPLKVFLPVSVLFFSLGLLNYLYTFFTEHRFTNMTALLISTSVVIFMMGFVAEQLAQIRSDGIQEETE